DLAPLADTLVVHYPPVRSRVECDDLPLLHRPEGPLGALDGEADTLIVPGLLLPVLGFDSLDDPLTLQRLELLPRRLVERVGPDGECQHAARDYPRHDISPQNRTGSSARRTSDYADRRRLTSH